jgi:hypothetical protein
MSKEKLMNRRIASTDFSRFETSCVLFSLLLHLKQI